jgi:hypothetical protein
VETVLNLCYRTTKINNRPVFPIRPSRRLQLNNDLQSIDSDFLGMYRVKLFSLWSSERLAVLGSSHLSFSFCVIEF